MKRLTQISLSLLASGALLVPALSLAAGSTTAATQAAPAAAATAPVDAQKAAGPLRKMVEGLNLTQDQRTKINGIIDAAQPSFAQLKQDTDTNKQNLRNITFANYDAAKVQSLADEQGKLVSKRIVGRAKLQQDIYNVLTPEQKKQVDAWAQQRAAEKAAKPHKKHK